MPKYGYKFNPNNPNNPNNSEETFRPNKTNISIYDNDPEKPLPGQFLNPGATVIRPYTLTRKPGKPGNIGPGSGGFANMITLAMILGILGVIVAYIIFRV